MPPTSHKILLQDMSKFKLEEKLVDLESLIIVKLLFLKIMDENYIGVKGSLERFRDFIHIDDVVTGWELCLLDKVKRNEIYNHTFNLYLNKYCI